jgi:hypothetical protein
VQALQSQQLCERAAAGEQKSVLTKNSAVVKKLAAEKAPVVNARTRIVADFYEHILRTDAAVEQARATGTLAAEVSDTGTVTYYSTAKPKRALNRTPAETARRGEKLAQRQAREAREAACIQAIAAAPKIPATGTVPAIVQTVVRSDSAILAMRWLAEAGIVTTTAAMSPYQFARHASRTPWSLQCAAAYALSLGHREMHVWAAYRAWTTTMRRTCRSSSSRAATP